MATRRQRQQVTAQEEIEKQESVGNLQTKFKLPDGLELLKLDGNRTSFDILPYEVKDSPHAEPGTVSWVRNYWAHRKVGAEGDDYVCLKKELRQPCPICEAMSKMAQDPNHDKDTVRELRPKQRQLFYIYDYADETYKIFEMSYHLFGKQLNNKVAAADDDDPLEAQYKLFPSPDEGLIVKTAWSAKKYAGHTYYEAGSIEFRERTGGQWDYDEVLDQAPDLDKMVLTVPYKELAEIFYEGTVETDDTDHDEARAPAKKRPGKAAGKKRPAKARPAPVDEDPVDEEDVVDGGEDDAEDEAPAKRPAKAAGKKRPGKSAAKAAGKKRPAKAKPPSKPSPEPEPEPTVDDEVTDDVVDMDDDMNWGEEDEW